MSFQGPLFIVGMPRSGTKLLRDLLNQSDSICIPSVETHFIPSLIDRFERPSDLEKRQEEFLSYFIKTSFYQNMKVLGYSVDTSDISKLTYDSWNTMLSGLLRKFVDKKDFLVWGDKSPSYLTQVQFLNEHFHDARFIHIIRDPRDYVLSCKTIWGKNIYRAAAKWNKNVAKCISIAKELESNYLQITYEELLAESESVMRKVCDFVEVPFQDKMLSLNNPLEEVASTKGKNYIVSSNVKKYKSKLSKKQLVKVEKLTFPTLQEVGYEYEYPISSGLNLNPIEKGFYVLADVLNKIKYHKKQRGFLEGIKYYFRVGLENLRNQRNQ